MSSEKVLHNEKNIVERINEIYNNFDWDTYHRIIDDYKHKFGTQTISTKNREELEKKKLEFRMELLEFLGVDLPEESKYPAIFFDSSIDSIASIKTYVHPHGLVTFNPEGIAKIIPTIAKYFRSLNIKVDFDLIYLVTIKILIHELLHKEGDLGVQSIVEEATVESLSYLVCIDYLNQSGTRTTKLMREIFGRITNFGFYRNEILLLNRLIALTIKKSKTDLFTFRYSLFKCFFEHDTRYVSHMRDQPENIRSLWERLHEVKLTDPDYVLSFSEISREISKLDS